MNPFGFMKQNRNFKNPLIKNSMCEFHCLKGCYVCTPFANLLRFDRIRLSLREKSPLFSLDTTFFRIVRTRALFPVNDTPLTAVYKHLANKELLPSLDH